MEHFLTSFAAAEASASDGIFGSLGIDWRMLVLQVVAFMVLVWVLGKFVYPVLVRVIDKREEAIEASVQAARQAEENAEQSQAEIDKLLKEARKEASNITEMAHKDAANQVKEAEDRAKQRAEQIVAEARQQLSQDIVKARKELRADTAELVALATEQVVRTKVDTAKDRQLIDTALKEAA